MKFVDGFEERNVRAKRREVAKEERQLALPLQRVILPCSLGRPVSFPLPRVARIRFEVTESRQYRGRGTRAPAG